MNVKFPLLLFALSVSITAAAQETRPDDQARLSAFLKKFPDSDLDQDGTLTRDEVRQFNQKQSKRNETATDSKRERPAPTADDVPYGTHQKQRFDLWVVPDATTSTPLVIFIHGGGFRGGDKNAFSPSVIASYHENGIAFASMNYRLSDAGPYPIMMEDCARGLQTIRHRAAEWNIDSNKIGCYGGSAGAGISLWLAFHDDLARPDSEDLIARQSTRISAAGTTNGQSTYDIRTFRKWFDVADLAPHSALLPLYGIEADSDWETERVITLMEAASPITHLSKDDTAPVYMTYSRGDVPVTRNTDANVWVHHYRLGIKLKEAMDSMGKECHVVARDHRPEDLKFEDMESFFAAHLKAK